VSYDELLAGVIQFNPNHVFVSLRRACGVASTQFDGGSQTGNMCRHSRGIYNKGL